MDYLILINKVINNFINQCKYTCLWLSPMPFSFYKFMVHSIRLCIWDNCFNKITKIVKYNWLDDRFEMYQSFLSQFLLNNNDISLFLFVVLPLTITIIKKLFKIEEKNTKIWVFMIYFLFYYESMKRVDQHLFRVFIC